MGGPFKMKYNNSSFPFKESPMKDGQIKTVVDKERVGPVENVDLDKEIEEHNIWHEEDEKVDIKSIDAASYIKGQQLRKKKLNIKK